MVVEPLKIPELAAQLLCVGCYWLPAAPPPSLENCPQLNGNHLTWKVFPLTSSNQQQTDMDIQKVGPLAFLWSTAGYSSPSSALHGIGLRLDSS